MSGRYTNLSRIPISTSSKLWNHLSSQIEDLDVNTPTLSGLTTNEITFPSQTSINNSPNLSIQITHVKNSANRQASATIISNNADTLSKPETPSFNLQMLIDNKQNQIKCTSEKKKDNFDLVTHLDMADPYVKLGQVNQTCFSSKNADKVFENENHILSHPSNIECSLLDTSIITSVSPVNYNNDCSINLDKELALKMSSSKFENSKSEMNIMSNDKCLSNNSSFSQKMLKLSSNMSVEKVMTENKEYGTIRDSEGLSVIVETKCYNPKAINLNVQSEKSIKDDPHDQYFDVKRKSNEFTLKASKFFTKKGKKGVDSLLEKVENGNKKLFNIDNCGSSVIISNTEERDINNVSMSPEDCKSRSPNNREDDVISPSFSNDDSNDMKQRRKRKLGKPIRLAKDFKFEQDDVDFDILKSKISNKSNLLHPMENNHEVVLQNPKLYDHLQKHVLQEKKIEHVKDDRIENCSAEKLKTEDKLKISDDIILKQSIIESKINETKQENNSKDLTRDLKLNDKDNDISNRYLIQSLKDSQRPRMRRNSECSVSIPSKNRVKRRKSCDDIKDLFYESDTKLSITAKVTTFNEVESQLEKMFAGIIENDKELLKKTILETEKSVDLMADDERKENIINSEKSKIKCTSDELFSDLRSNDYKNNKKKSVTKIRSGKKKKHVGSTKSFVETSNVSASSLRKDQKSQFIYKRSMKKRNIFRKTKENVKVNSCREMMCDATFNVSPAKLRGPIVQIKGSKISPMYIQIINAPREDDEEKYKERRKCIGNGTVSRNKSLNYQNSLNYHGKGYNAGLFNSTLSMRYDARTADLTWICVFCKRGPHYMIPGNQARPVNVSCAVTGSCMTPSGVLSDLFGPYVITKDTIEDIVMSCDEQEITAEQKQGNKNKRSLRYVGVSDQFVASTNKLKNKISNFTSSTYMGMTLLSTDDQQWEVWLHEECIIWTAGVYITGGRISGLQDAIWDASKSICDSCGLSGANIGCIKRGCKSFTHYCCALTGGWHLDMNQYIPNCSIHKMV